MESGLSNAFQFDSWTSGMSLRQAIALAQDKDIPILKESARFHQ
jgi:hypothetical protein